jgi:hypothetical protein
MPHIIFSRYFSDLELFFIPDVNLCFALLTLHVAGSRRRLMAAEAVARTHGGADTCGRRLMAAAQDGWTALMCAARFGHADCARLLLDAGADKNAKSNVRARAAVDGVAWGVAG